jgi:hypothetical protein
MSFCSVHVKGNCFWRWRKDEITAWRVPQMFIRNCIFTHYSYKKAISYLSYLEFVTHTHWFIIDSFIQRVLRFVFISLHSRFLCRYIFKAMYSFVPPFHEAKFCDMPSSVFDQLGCAAGEKRLRNTGTDRWGEMYDKGKCVCLYFGVT